MALFQGKKNCPAYSIDPEKTFQSPKNRLIFARELSTRCTEKQPFEQKLEETLFDYLCAIIKKIMTEARKTYDGKTARFLVPITGYFYRAPRTTFETHYFLYVKTPSSPLLCDDCWYNPKDSHVIDTGFSA